MAKILQLTDKQRAVYMKYSGLSLPRYPPYPSITQWNDLSGITTTKEQLDAVAREHKAFALYFHLPFCERLGLYCSSQKEMMNPASPLTQKHLERYLLGLEKELARLAHHLDKCVIEKIHFGGGTPNFLGAEQWRLIQENILSRLTISEHAEFSVELDPHTIRAGQIALLHEIGVNRVSLGVQDFDPSGQKVIHSPQSYEEVAAVVEACRSQGIAYINFDLIYGLPAQNPESLLQTLDQLIRFDPDRIAYFSFASIPALFPGHMGLQNQELLEGEQSLDLNLLGVNRLLAAGYEFINLEQFAKNHESTAIAVNQTQLHRNSQAVCNGASLPILGFGASATSMIDRVYVQNPQTTQEWLLMLDCHDFQRKTHILTTDDCIRRDVIKQVVCQGRIDKREIETLHKINFDDYFSSIALNLMSLKDDEVIRLDKTQIVLTEPLGFLLRRVLAAVFDAYLPAKALRFGLGESFGSQLGYLSERAWASR